MSESAANNDAHEVVVDASLSHEFERLGMPGHAGERVRLEFIRGERSDEPPDHQGRSDALPSFVGIIKDGPSDLAARSKEILRAEFARR